LLPLAVIQVYKGSNTRKFPCSEKFVPVFKSGRSVTAHCVFKHPLSNRVDVSSSISLIFKPFKVRCPFSPVYPPFACPTFSLIRICSLHCLSCLFVSLTSISPSVWLSSSYSTLPHTGRTRPPGPHPVPCISIITHAHTRWSRYHQARLPPLHHGPGSRSCLGLSPRPTRKAQSRPLRTSRRLAGLTRTARRDALLSRHDSLRPPASSGRTSRTNHDSTQPTCAQWSWSRSSRTGVAGPAPGPTAADPSGATRLALPPHHHSSCDRDKHTPRPPAASARFCSPQPFTCQASPSERAASQGCE